MSSQTDLSKKICIKKILIALFAILLFFFIANPFLLFNKTIFYIFQSRDIKRALEILQGHFVFFGPEMTGGGNLPGPLYYLVLSFALFFKANWISAWIMQLILSLVGVVAGALYFHSRSSLYVTFLWITAFSSALFTSFYLRLFLNVSSMLCFTILSLVFILNSATLENPKKRIRYFLLACLIIGAGIQFHFSLVALLAALYFIQLFHRQLNLLNVPKKYYILGLCIFALPSAPYLIWLLIGKFGWNFGQPAFYTGETEQALLSVAYLLKLGMAAPWADLLKAWLAKILYTVPFPLFVLFISSLGGHSLRIEKEIKILAACTIFAFAPYVNWFFSTQGMRYSMPFYISLIFLTLMMFKNILHSRKVLKRFNILALLLQIVVTFIILRRNPHGHYQSLFLITFVLAAIIAGINVYLRSTKAEWMAVTLMMTLFVSQRYFPNSAYSTPDGYMPTNTEWSHIWKTIIMRTGWSYEEAKTKIYYVGHHVNQDPELFLSGFFQPPFHTEGRQQPDGFFVSNRYGNYLRNKEGKLPAPKDWLLKQNLHSDILDALRDGKIKLGKNLSRFSLIVPYWTVDDHNLPKHFHNSGEGYNISKEDLLLTKIPTEEGIAQLDSSSYLFKWNESKERADYNSTGAIVSLTENKNTYALNIKIIGTTLSQITPWVSPNWTQAWIKPYVEIKCGKETKKIELSDSIGFRRTYSHLNWTPFFSGNNSFIGPFERSFSIFCKDKIHTIALGRESSTVEMIREVKTLPGKRLELKL